MGCIRSSQLGTTVSTSPPVCRQPDDSSCYSRSWKLSPRQVQRERRLFAAEMRKTREAFESGSKHGSPIEVVLRALTARR